MKLTVQDNLYLLSALQYNGRMRDSYVGLGLNYGSEVVSKESLEDVLEGIFELFKYNGDDIVQFLDKALYAESRKIVNRIIENTVVDDEDIRLMQDLGNIEEPSTVNEEERDFEKIIEELKLKESNN